MKSPTPNLLLVHFCETKDEIKNLLESFPARLAENRLRSVSPTNHKFLDAYYYATEHGTNYLGTDKIAVVIDPASILERKEEDQLKIIQSYHGKNPITALLISASAAEETLRTVYEVLNNHKHLVLHREFNGIVEKVERESLEWEIKAYLEKNPNESTQIRSTESVKPKKLSTTCNLL